MHYLASYIAAAVYETKYGEIFSGSIVVLLVNQVNIETVFCLLRCSKLLNILFSCQCSGSNHGWN